MSKKEQVVKLRAKGKTYAEISEILQCAPSLVSYHLSEGSREKGNIRKKKSRKNAMKKIRDLKESSGCIDCGGKFEHFILEFDHLPEFEKKGSPVHIATTVSMQAAIDEIAKCDIVCANCHRARTWNRLSEDMKSRA